MPGLFAAVLDIVFPPACCGCGLPGTLLCDVCAGRVVRIDPAQACVQCGAPVEASVSCAECGGRVFAFSAARCATVLAPPVSHAVVALKDGGERRYAQVLASLLAEAASGWLGSGHVLVPVPATRAAVRRRGFDHTADITRALARTSGVPMRRLLVSAPRADQRVLGREERFANRRGSFALAPGTAPPDAGRGGPVPASVVLVDDVFTTGATLDAAATALTNAGVARVRALAVARAMREK